MIGQAHFPYINCLGLSDDDNSVTRTDNFVNVNVFSSVLHLLLHSLTVAFCTIS